MQQGKSVILGLKKNGQYGQKPVVASLWGGAEDANSFLFKSGVDATLNPLYKNGTLVKGPQQHVPGWNNQTAGTIFQQMLIRTSNNIDGVAAANDGLANAVVVALKAAGLDPLPLSGQDATTQGVQNVIAGWQTATVWKDERKLADRNGRGRDQARQGPEAPDDGIREDEGPWPGAGLPDPAEDDHQGQLEAAAHQRLLQADRDLQRRVQEVLLGRRRLSREAPLRGRFHLDLECGRTRAIVSDTPTPLLELRGVS